jgi:hypothetical protein
MSHGIVLRVMKTHIVLEDYFDTCWVWAFWGLKARVCEQGEHNEHQCKPQPMPVAGSKDVAGWDCVGRCFGTNEKGASGFLGQGKAVSPSGRSLLRMPMGASALEAGTHRAGQRKPLHVRFACPAGSVCLHILTTQRNCPRHYSRHYHEKKYCYEPCAGLICTHSVASTQTSIPDLPATAQSLLVCLCSHLHVRVPAR